MCGMNEERVQAILSALPGCKVAVVGDFCVDRYFDIDPDISDVSNETGLPIHQVTKVRPEPGGGANVLNNLAALGVGEVYPVGFIGLDGEGFELARIFDSLEFRLDFLRRSETRHTPVFVKPLIARPDAAPEELNRFDIFPRDPLSEDEEAELVSNVRTAFEAADALIVADYGEAGKAGIVTARVRETVAELARTNRKKPVLADSRLYIDRFRHVVVKPNADEAMRYLGGQPDAERSITRLTEIGQRAAERNKRPVLITLGPDGILLCAPGRAQKIPVYPSENEGEIDIVGAGDAVLAAIAAAVAVTAPLDEAAILGMIAASITIQEIGRCGTASPDQIRARFKQYAEMYPDVVGA